MHLIDISYAEKNKFYNVKTMEEWLNKLPKDQLKKWIELSNQNEFNVDQISDIVYHATIIYSLEMEMDSIDLTDILANSLYKDFINNIIIYTLKMKGLVDTGYKIVLYKDYKISATEAGKNYVENLNVISSED